MPEGQRGLAPERTRHFRAGVKLALILPLWGRCPKGGEGYPASASRRFRRARGDAIANDSGIMSAHTATITHMAR